MYPRHFDKAVPFDSIEQMQMNANPTSEYVQGVVAALNRKMDDEAIRAFFDARNVGESGSTSDTFAAAYQVGVSVGGTTSGLNVEKLQNAIQIFEENEVDLDMEQLYCVISPKQKRNLMNEIEVTSGDFFKGQVMSTRNVSGFLSGDELALLLRTQFDPSVLDGLPVSLLLVFVLLFAMFGNVKDGLLVFTGIPFALTGGILALWLRDIPMSISAAVGFIALSGEIGRAHV